MEKRELVTILLRAKGNGSQLFIGIADFLRDYKEFEVTQLIPSIVGTRVSATIIGKYPMKDISDIKRLNHHGESFYENSKLDDVSVDVFVLSETEYQKPDSLYSHLKHVIVTILSRNGVQISTIEFLNNITAGRLTLSERSVKTEKFVTMSGFLLPLQIKELRNTISKSNLISEDTQMVLKVEPNDLKKKTKVCYDVDDTLWGLNSVIYNDTHVHGLKYSDAITFCPYDNHLLTREQQDAVIACYHDPEIFRELEFYQGIDRLYDIEDTGLAEVWINSSNCSTGVMDIKHLRLLYEVPNINPDHIRLTVSPDHSREPGDILVDDSIANIENSDFRYYILIDHPWNTLKPENEDLFKRKKIFRVYSLNEAIDLVEEIIKNGGNINE